MKLIARDILQALYLPGDASGAGFGSATIKKDGIMYGSGTWTWEWATSDNQILTLIVPYVATSFLRRIMLAEYDHTIFLQIKILPLMPSNPDVNRTLHGN